MFSEKIDVKPKPDKVHSAVKKAFVFFYVILLSFSFCACGQNGTSSQNSSASTKNESNNSGSKKEDSEKLTYPYKDTDGRLRYKLYINGKLVKTQHDPYTYPEEPNGAYYPIVEVLDYLGVECLFDEHLMTLTTKINGQILKCSADNKDIAVGKTTLGGTAPEYIENCFYVPSYTFMQLLDAVVDFTSDRSGVTMTTNMVINPATSGISGLTVSADTATDTGKKLYTGSEACPTCGGTGKILCTRCSGTGSVTQYIQSRNPVTNQMTMQSTKAHCTSCGGSGHLTCNACGGTGKR